MTKKSRKKTNKQEQPEQPEQKNIDPKQVLPPKPAADLVFRDIGHEMWREYVFHGRKYRIASPKLLVMRPNGSTHRIVSRDGVTHCVPAPGHHGCVVRWKNPSGMSPVMF